MLGSRSYPGLPPLLTSLPRYERAVLLDPLLQAVHHLWTHAQLPRDLSPTEHGLVREHPCELELPVLLLL